ncbi:MAG: DNA primase [Ignavibacteria bacterium]|nr:DNA primase [Ignavibacteria bacterium]
MNIPQSKIDEISASLDIVDVISAYTPLRKAGKSFMGRCPYHEEKTPSFSVSQEKGVFHCFGCGKSGNMFTFVMDMENFTFFDTVKFLADKANITIEFENEPFDPDRNKVEIYYDINKKAGKYFYEKLNSREGAYAKEYLNTRGLKDDTIVKFGLGYSLRDKDALYREFENDYTAEDIQGSGLILQLGAGEIRDRFRGRLMFPIFNEAGRVVGFGGRRMYDESTDEAKYINSPETKIYNKSKILYGLNFAKNAIKQKGFVLLVEGYMDLISLFQKGIENVVASSGTSLTQLHSKILSRYTKEVVVVYDADLAGQNASRRAIELLVENDINVSILELPYGDDPDTYIQKNGIDGFERLLNNRLSIIDYIAERYETDGKMNSPEGKTEFVREIIGLIVKMRDAIKRDFYIKGIAEKFSIYESIIRKELDSVLKLKSRGLTRETNTDRPVKKPKERVSKFSAVELVLIRLLIDSDDKTKSLLMNELEMELISNDTVRKIVNYIMLNIDSPEKITHIQLFNEFQDEEAKDIIGKALLDENLIMQDIKSKNHLGEANSVLSQLKLYNIRNKIKDIEIQIKSSNDYSPEILRLLNTQQKLKREQIKIEKSLRS